MQCIQAGRWNPEKEQNFTSLGGEVTSSSLRFTNKSQGDVWDTISSTATVTGTLSPSSDYTVIKDLLAGNKSQSELAQRKLSTGFGQSENFRSKVQNIIHEASNIYRSEQVGILAIIIDSTDGCVKYCLEIINDQALYKKVHKNLIEALAIDVVMLSEKYQNVKIPDIDTITFANFLKQIQGYNWISKSKIGIEERYEFSAINISGELVLKKGALVHLIFSTKSLFFSAAKEKIQATIEKQVTRQNWTTKGDYKIVKTIGRGAAGTVYLAKNKKNNQLVAMKVMEESLRSNEKAINRFLQEAKVHSSLNHPNIIKMYEAGYDDKKGLFVILEYVDGDTIENLINRRGRLKEKHAMQIAIAIAKALKYAHSNTIIHRDLKPQNIMLSKNLQVKIADMGLAKIANSSKESITLSGQMMGTLYYMPPEQIKDAKKVDHQADIYSLGASLYHMITGEPPYSDTKGALQILRAKMMRDPIPVTEYVKDIDPKIEGIITKSMAKDLTKRYETIEDMLKDMNNYLGCEFLVNSNLTKEEHRYIPSENHVTEECDNLTIAFDREKKREVLLHLVSSGREYNKEVLGKLSREIGNLSDIAHPNVLKIYGVEYYIDTKNLYIVSECPDGESLKTILENQEAISEHNALKIIRAILKVLTHMDGLNHYGLTLSHIWVCKNNKIKIYGAGLEKILMEQIEDYEQIKDMVKNVRYQSPEHDKDFRDISALSDIYSIGSILYKMLSGKDPFFETEEIEEIISDKCSIGVEPFEDISQKHTSKRTKTILRKTMKIEPEDRYQNYEELKNEVEKALAMSNPAWPTGIICTQEVELHKKYTSVPDIKVAYGDLVRNTKNDSLLVINTPFIEIKKTQESIREAINHIMKLTQIYHPNILRVYGAEYYLSTDTFCICMEYAQEKNLEQIIKEGAFEELKALKIIQKIALALQYCMKKSLFHTNLSPKNIYMATNPQTLKISEIGIEQVLQKYKGTKVSGEVLYDVSYVAPERIDKEYDTFKTDIYSLGAILYYLVSGKAPFHEERGSYAKLRKKENSKPLHIKELNENISKKTADIIEKCMQQNRENRYANYKTFLHDIDFQIQALESIEKSPIVTFAHVPKQSTPDLKVVQQTSIVDIGRDFEDELEQME